MSITLSCLTLLAFIANPLYAVLLALPTYADEQAIASPTVSPIPTVDNELWQMLTTGQALTRQPVSVTSTYVAPQNKDVVVNFTTLPDNPDTLTIQEVKLSSEQQQHMGALSDTAYDISSSMPNGSFRYDLTLPKPAGVKAVTVKYAETLAELSDAQAVTQSTDEQATTVSITGLDHFTVFVLVNDITNGGTAATTDDVANGQLATIKDAWVNESSATQNNGDAVSLQVRSQNSNRNQRALIQFDTNSVSAASLVTNATLRVYMTGAPSNDRIYELYRLTSAAWVEGDGGTNNNPAGEVRWDNQPTSSLAATSTAHTGTSNGVWLEFDVTADIQGFLAGTANYGWFLKDAVESESGTSRTATLRSRESNTQNQRPQLIVDFAANAQANQYHSPAASQADASVGDADGFELNASNAFADGGGFASNINGNGDRHIFSNYNFTIPVGATINGLEARADWFLDSTAGVNSFDVNLSWDGGTTWTAAKTDATETLEEHISSFGGAADTWGRTWSASAFTNSNFKVRITSVSDSTSRDFFLDWLPVRVYYTPDTTAPIITLVGSTPVTVEAGSTYTDAGATATDTIDGTLTNSIVKTGLPVNTLVLGAHTITYTVSDAAGNVATAVTRTVNVQDTTAPTNPTNVTSSSHTSASSSDPTIDMAWTAAGSAPGATDGASGVDGYSYNFSHGATDVPDTTKDLEETVAGVTSSTLSDGTWYFHLRTVDNSGNWTTATHSGPFIIDTTAPTTSSAGTDTAWHNTSVTITFACADSTSGCLRTYYTTNGSTPTVSGASGTAVVLSLDGQYTIKYFSIDNAGNSESVKTLTDVVKIDSTSPTIPGSAVTLPIITNNLAPVWSWAASIDSGSGLMHYAWRAVKGAMTLTGTTVTASATPTLAEGVWSFFVKALDSATNQSTEAAAGSVTVDTTKPVITLVGSTPVTVEAGSTYTDAGATAIDTIDGTLTNSMVTTGLPITTTIVGSYTVTYNVSDAAGNAAVPVTRKVNVVDTTPPVVPLLVSPASGTKTKPIGLMLDWSDGSDISNISGPITYRYQSSLSNSTAGANNAFVTPLVISGVLTSSNFDVSGSADIAFYWQVRGCDTLGNCSHWSGPWQVVIDGTAPALPVASTAGGDYFADQNVTLTSFDGNGFSMYYTLDSSTPTAASTLFTGSAIVVNHSLTLKAVAIDAAANASSILTQIYGIAPLVVDQSIVNDTTAVSGTQQVIAWATDDPSTSRVVYDGSPVPVLGSAPNYGYAESTAMFDTSPKVTNHVVTLTGLEPDKTYYYRVISTGSPATVGSEHGFTTGATDSDSNNGGGGSQEENTSIAATASTSDAHVAGAITSKPQLPVNAPAADIVPPRPVLLKTVDTRTVTENSQATANIGEVAGVSTLTSPSRTTPTKNQATAQPTNAKWWYLLLAAIVVSGGYYGFRRSVDWAKFV